MKNIAVFINRFQPMNTGHQEVIAKAITTSNPLLILIGSATTSPSVSNPFDFRSRELWIKQIYPEEVASGQIIIKGLSDCLYNDAAWSAEVQRAVLDTSEDAFDQNVTLVGVKEDHISYYTTMFPKWRVEGSSPLSRFKSRDLRNAYFHRNSELPNYAFPPTVIEFLKGFRASPQFKDLVMERDFLDAYKASWAQSPFPPVFVTVDAVVLQGSHVLLVRRGGQPGKGQLALPGGFINPNENLREAVLRELSEETEIADCNGKLATTALDAFICDDATRVFDSPHRSIRGRVITHAFLFRCPVNGPMFNLRGGDDAAHAGWYGLGELKQNQFFEDHFSILREMISL